MSDSFRWPYAPGQPVRRVELRSRIGGKPQGGISPSNSTPNICLFHGNAGRKFGYVDGWHPDGAFHYTGEGQVGEQEMRHGNRMILECNRSGRALRLFEGTSGVVTYVGQFELDPLEPFYRSDALDVNKKTRTVIVFRLRPVGEAERIVEPPELNRLPPDAQAVCKEIPLEAVNTDSFEVGPQSGRSGKRREGSLVEGFNTEHIRQHGRSLVRLYLQAPGEGKFYLNDIYDSSADRIIEVKANSTREAARMVVGQLLDYRQLSGRGTRLAVLLPNAPRPTIAAFLATCGVEIIYRDADGRFVDAGPVVRPSSKVA